MKLNKLRRRDGFEGEKMIMIPETVLRQAQRKNPVLSQLFVGSMGYFPKAFYHYRERKTGCVDNILLYCLRGRGWYILKDEIYEVSANEFVIIPATREYLRYGAHAIDPWTIYWVHFSSKDINAFNKGFGIDKLRGAQKIALNENGLQLWDKIYEDLSMGYSMENLASANLCLYHLIATFLFPNNYVNVKKQESKDMIQDTIVYMRSEFRNKLTVDDMARKNNLSVSHFTILFRKATGMSPLDYFIHLKLQKACIMLYSTEVKLRHIADEIGYDDPYYFSRLFKKHMKISPDQYRKLRRTQT